MSSHRARAFLLLLAAALLTTGTAHGQATGTIRGVVRLASTNRPIDLAQVSVVGTQLGARTREDGTFQINNVPVGTVQVRVVRIGHAAVTRTVEVAAGQAVVLELTLREAPLALEELVVTGTAAEARKKELGNSLAAIRSEEILSVPVANIQDVIGARAAGVTVLANSGQPGAGGAIRLRGNNSISQSNAPVVYVDGIRIYSDAGPTNVFARQGALTMNDIPANDIERVEIVKGAAATTLYGTEASGGVIQIFTKRGVAGAPAWEAGMGFGYNDIDHIGPDSDETGFFVKQCRGAQLVNSAGQPFVDPTCPESGSWVQKGLVQRYSLSVRGGAQNLTYSLSGNYDDQEGAIQTGGAKVGSFRGNFTFAPRSDLNFQLSTGYTRRSIRWVGDGNNASGFLLNVSRGANSNYKNPVYCSGVATGTTCVANEEIFNESNYTRGDHFITGLVANWNPTARLTNRFSVGFDYSYSDDQSARPFGNYRSPAGIINKIDWLHTKLSIDYAGSYQAPLGESWTSTTSWGGQMFRDKDNFTRVDAQNFAGPGDPTIGGAANSSVLESDRIQVVNGGFFGQQMFGLRDRLFLTAGLRVDGNSAFGEDFGMQAYPKLGASWVAVDSRDGALQTARLRLAAGESGKAPGAFDAVKTWNPIAGDEGKPAVTPSQLGNPNLGPERTREIEGGFDLAALDGRLGVEATYFYARTFDALVPVDYPPSQGFIATQLENVGTLESKGLELSIEGNPIRSESFDWRLRGILTAVQTKAVDLNGEVIQFGDSRAEVREGYPVPSFFGRKITNPNDFAEPIVEEDQFLGSNYPDRVMSLQTTFVLFRRLTIDALGEWQTGAYVYNGIGYQNALRFVFQPCYEAQAKLNAFAGGDATALDDVTARDRGRCAIDRTKQNDRYWIDATDFFKLRTVSVTYDVPMAVAQKLRLRSASVTAAGRNLFTSTDYQGTDPEVADGRDAASDSGSGPLSSNTSRVGRRDYYNLPPLRSFVFTLRLGF